MRTPYTFSLFLSILLLAGCGQKGTTTTGRLTSDSLAAFILQEKQHDREALLADPELMVKEWIQYPIPEVHGSNEPAILDALHSFNRLWTTEVCSGGLELADDGTLTEVERDGNWRYLSRKGHPWLMTLYKDSDTEGEYVRIGNRDSEDDSMEAQLLRRDDGTCWCIVIWHNRHLRRDIVCTYDCGKGMMRPVLSILDRFKPSYTGMKPHVDLNNTGTDITIREEFDSEPSLSIRHVYEWDGEAFVLIDRLIDNLPEDLTYTKYAVVPLGKTLALWLSDEEEATKTLLGIYSEEPMFRPIVGAEVKTTPVWRSFGEDVEE